MGNLHPMKDSSKAVWISSALAVSRSGFMPALFFMLIIS